MKRQLRITINLLIFIGLTIASLSAQNIDYWYVSMPDNLNPTLSKQNRHELVEYYKANPGDDSIANKFNHQAYLQKYDSINQLIVVKNTPVSTFEMKMFSMDDKTPVIGMISTVCASVCQSSIDFYDTAWNKIPLKFTMPKAVEWLKKDTTLYANVDKQWVENVLENSYIKLSFGVDGQSIIAQNESLDFLNDKEKEIISPLLSDKPIILVLRGREWVTE